MLTNRQSKSAACVSWRVGLGLAALVIGICGCAGPKAKQGLSGQEDKRFGLSSKHGADAFSKGLYENAAEAYLQALNYARRLDKPAAAASAAYNLAACYSAMRQFDLARDYLVEARSEFERVEDPGGIGESWLLEAKMAQAEENYVLSAQFCDQALAVLEQDRKSASIGAHVYLLKAELACQAGEIEQANVALKAARRSYDPPRGAPLYPATLAVEAHILAAEHAQGKAALKYDAAAAAYGDINAAHLVAEMLSKAADLYARDMQHSEAGTRFYLAARSYYAQGQVNLALKRLDAAFASAKLADDTKLNQNCTALFRSIKQQVRSE